MFSRETIDAYVQESTDQFANSRIAEFVPLMVERFARQRLRALAQAEGKMTKAMPEVLFVCVHNSGRSQMAAGLLDKLADDRVHVRSAGSDPADQLNPNAVKAMAEAGVDISKEFPKPLTDDVVRAADVVITMGCGDACPIYPGKRYEDWDLEDPEDKDLETVRQIRDDIHDRVEALIEGHRDERRTVSETMVAVITDIHGNLPALEAALARIDELGIDTTYCGGDLVGYGPWPNEVCRLIQEREIPTIYGNYDYAIGRDEEDCMCAYPQPARSRPRPALGDLDTRAHDRTSKDFMRELPFDLRFDVGGRRILLVHGSPRKVNEYLFEDKPAKTFERIAAGADCDVMVFGHTHKPWIHSYGDTLFVNCGSVGKPKDGDPRGGFAILESVGGDITARIERFAYDADYAASQVAEAGLPGEYAEKLLAAA